MLEMLVCSISTPLLSDAIASLIGQLSHKYFSPVNPHSSWTLLFFFYFFNSHMEADIKIKYSLYSAKSHVGFLLFNTNQSKSQSRGAWAGSPSCTCPGATCPPCACRSPPPSAAEAAVSHPEGRNTAGTAR